VGAEGRFELGDGDGGGEGDRGREEGEGEVEEAGRAMEDRVHTCGLLSLVVVGG